MWTARRMISRNDTRDLKTDVTIEVKRKEKSGALSGYFEKISSETDIFSEILPQTASGMKHIIYHSKSGEKVSITKYTNSCS